MDSKTVRYCCGCNLMIFYGEGVHLEKIVGSVSKENPDGSTAYWHEARSGENGKRCWSQHLAHQSTRRVA